jgi:DNA invertase Pin-like site-specific DNA recombinase
MLGIYCRISREKEEGKDRSIADQKALGIELAQRLSTEYKVYIDEGYSGTLENIEDRPSFSRMIDDIQEGIIDSVFVFDQSRLERNPQIRYVIKKIFKDNNTKLFTHNGEVKSNNDEEEMFGDLMSVYNQYYVKITSKKIKSVLRRNAKEGKVHSSIFPYGYGKDDKGYLIVNEEEAEIVKRIYSESLQGLGTNKIAERLNGDGILTRYNKISEGTIKVKNKYTKQVSEKNKTEVKWAGNTVRGIIKNPIYKGERHFGGEVFDAPIIIEFDLWEEVNNNLPRNSNNSGKKVDHKYLLKGFLECAYCGRNMYGRTRVNKKDNYYMCSSKRLKEQNCGNKSINIDVLDDFIWSSIFTEYDIKNAILKDESESGIDKLSILNREIEELEKEKSSYLNEKKRAIELVVKGTLKESEVRQIIDANDIKVSDINIRMENLKEEMRFEERATGLKEDLFVDIQLFKEETPFNKRQETIRKYIRRIRVYFDKEIQYYYITVKFNTQSSIKVYPLNGSSKAIRNYLKGDKTNTMSLDFLGQMVERAQKYEQQEMKFL